MRKQPQLAKESHNDKIYVEKYLSKKSRNEKKLINYKRQKNFCTNLRRKTKQKYCCNLNIKDLNHFGKNKTFFLGQRFTDYNIRLKKQKQISDGYC